MAFGFIKKVAKGTVKTVADVPAWLGLSYLKNNTIGIIRMVRPMYEKPHLSPKQKMSFDQAVKQYNLSDEDLASRVRYLSWQSWMFGALAVLAFSYAIYLFSGVHLLAGLLALCIALYLIVKVSTCRFWIFQIKKRKLGCSIEEWLKGNHEG